MTARPRILAAIGALTLGLGGAIAVASPAAATVDSYTVDNLSADPAVVGSLPWAVDQAEQDVDHTTIDFVAGLTGVIPLNAQFVIAHPLTIIGPGSAVLTVTGPPTIESVIDFLNTGVPPIMSVSGLTLASSGSNLHGISTDDADLTLVDIVADGFLDSGVYAAHANLTASHIQVNDSALNGFGFFGDSGDSLVLDHVTANNNGSPGAAGVNAEIIDGNSRIDTVAATGNGGYGMTLTVSGGTLTASGITVDGGSTAGIGVGALDGADVTLSDSTVTGIDSTGSGYSLTNLASTLTVRNSTADANDGDGFRIGGDQGGTTTATALTATSNKLGGLSLFALGGSQLAVEASSIEKNGADPCLCGGPGITVVAEASDVSIAETSITDNHAKVGAGVSVFGLAQGSSLAISGSTISGNHAVDGGNGAGGGLAVGDPVFSLGLRDDSTVTVTDSTISGNDAEIEGGGVALYDLGSGAPTGGVTLLRTTVDGNRVTGLGGGCCDTAGGGILLAGAEANSAGTPVLSIQGSTVSNNSVVGGDGGGLFLAQGPGYSTALVDILGSTISGNSADGDGAAAFLDATSADPGTFRVALRQTTVADNAIVGGGSGAGGVFVAGQNAELSLDSTIVGDNGSNDLSFDAAIGLFAARYSLVQNPVGAGIPLDPAQGNLTGASPKLGPLANNGGSTQTMLVSPGSPAFNAGDPAFAGDGVLDQRGQARVYQVIDLGSVEWQPALAATGTELTARPALIALFLLLTGLAMVTFSRRRAIIDLIG